MLYRIENCYGNFNLKECYDSETNETFYDVYTIENEEEIYGEYLGEFYCDAEYDEDDDNEYFLEQFDNWCEENI